MKKYRKASLILSLILILIITGCIPAPKILEDIQLIQSVGYDYHSEKELLGSAGTSYIPPGEDAQPRNLVFTTVGKTGKQIRQKIQALSAKPIEIGRVGVVIFNEEVASKGVFPLIDNLQRDSSIGRNILLAVSVGSAGDILKTNYTEGDSVSQYIIDVIGQNMEQTIPNVNFHHFLFQYYTPGFDPFMPLVTKKENKLEVLGIALFDDDKYVGMVPLEKSYIFKILYEDTKKGHFEMEGEEDGYISMQNLYTHTNYEVRRSNEGYEVNFRIKMKGRIAESGGLDLSKEKNIKKAEKKAAEEITKEAYSLMEQFKKLNVDPLGLGEKARQKGLFVENTWKELYPDLKVNIQTEVHIIQTGIIE